MAMHARIRPLSVGELLDTAFRLYRNTFVHFIGIAAVVQVPYMLLNGLLQLPIQRQLAALQAPTNQLDPFAGQSPGAFFAVLAASVVGAMGLSILYTIVLLPLLEGALAFAVARRYLDQPISIGSCFSAAARRALSLIGARFLSALIGMLFGFLGILLFVGLVIGVLMLAGGSETTTGIIGGVIGVLGALVGLLLLLLVIIFFVVRLLFTSQVIMVEGAGAIESIRRSWRLTSGYFWRTCGILLLVGLIVGLISTIPGLVVTVPTSLLLQDQPDLQVLISTLLSTILNVVALPFSMICYTLIYFDLRVRKEGFDLEQQAGAVLGAPFAPTAS